MPAPTTIALARPSTRRAAPLTPAPRRPRSGARRRAAPFALGPSGGDAGVSAALEAHAGEAVASISRVGSSGWSSQARYTLQSGRTLFVKTAQQEPPEGMFSGEAAGLRAMRHAASQAPQAAPALVIPEVALVGPLLDAQGLPAARGSFIAMECLEFGPKAKQGELGEALARMHLAESLDAEAAEGRYGFRMDNTIGGTPQPNAWSEVGDWVGFFGERRLRHMCRQARDGELTKLVDGVVARLPALMEGAELRPCVLHGDLWSGNIAGMGGRPAIFDPATYYGHAEAEFGMSWCAGFGADFYAGYHGVLPKRPGHEERAALYQLYHYLNHYVLFGGGYRESAAGIARRLA